MRPREISNPPNPWASSEVQYLEEVPRARLELYEDHSASILAKNDSPDVGFEFSVNPYRGCMHACAYCLAADTPILLASGQQKALASLRVGDEVYGTVLRGNTRRLVRTRVFNHWATVKPAFLVRLVDGTELVASGDHRLLTQRGWRFVHPGPGRRLALSRAHELFGTGRFDKPREENEDYRRGYLCGMIRAGAALGTAVVDARKSVRDRRRQPHVALVDLEALHRSRRYLREFSVETTPVAFQRAAGMGEPRYALQAPAETDPQSLEDLTAWPMSPSSDWRRGLLAGAFDADGSVVEGVVRYTGIPNNVRAELTAGLCELGFESSWEPTGLRLRGGTKEVLRFFHTVQPAASRKQDLADLPIQSTPELRVASVESLGRMVPMFDITTGTGDFIANGVVSHNCYARPSHEYLSFGAGTDFETKIVYKPAAGALLRAAFNRPSWTGKRIIFSGVTDCYQPVEASLRLTRSCLEVCAEYRNPVGIITKAPLVERDVDVLQELAKTAGVRVNVSIPFWNPEHARAVEPYVATPKRRLQTVSALARAGVPVGVMVAPIIPGLNDEDMPAVLQAAKDAGATSAGYVLLRLPGSVKEVFEERIRATLPLRAERILHRIRETRDGKMYDSRFGVRGRGTGPYAQALGNLFETTATRLGFLGHSCDEPVNTFRRPLKPQAQLQLF